MAKLFLLTLFLSQSIFSPAQDSTDDSTLRSLIKLDLGLQGIGISFEPKLSNKMSIDFSLGAGGAYEISEEGISYEWNIPHSAFYISAVPKFYYNRQKRSVQGKNNKLNSGNYIGARIRYTTSSYAPYQGFSNNALLLNVHWGLQRALGRRFIFNTHVGAGYARDVISNFGTIYPAIDFKFSYVLARLNK